MPRRPQHPAKDSEARIRSDRVSEGRVPRFAAALNARPAKISRDFDVPYVAATASTAVPCSSTATCRCSFRYRGRVVHTDRFLIVHEVVEKALLDQLDLHYLHAHQVALRVEQAAARAAGIGWLETTTSRAVRKRRSGRRS